MMHALLLVAACALAASQEPGEEVISKFAERTYQFTGGPYENETFRYRLLSPETIEPGKKYPVVLFLHGRGESGDDNVAQLKYLPTLMATPEYQKKFPCFFIAPQCREGKLWVARGPDKTGVSEQMQVAEAVLQETLKKYPIDPARVYLTGLSMGGFGAWNLAARHPDWFAAMVPICGGGDPNDAAELAKLPIWAVHGSDDKVVPPSLSRTMVEAVRAAGGNVKYSELPGVGHDSWTPAYEDPQGALPWMFEQKKPAAAK
ncbi:MAG TPA: PHB depolymerase family esterase [Pirellulales bacterium]|nr:PHB depolymerase family esterase [Pirellulales bacterium]